MGRVISEPSHHAPFRCTSWHTCFPHKNTLPDPRFTQNTPALKPTSPQKPACQMHFPHKKSVFTRCEDGPCAKANPPITLPHENQIANHYLITKGSLTITLPHKSQPAECIPPTKANCETQIKATCATQKTCSTKQQQSNTWNMQQVACYTHLRKTSPEGAVFSRVFLPQSQ